MPILFHFFKSNYYDCPIELRKERRQRQNNIQLHESRNGERPRYPDAAGGKPLNITDGGGWNDDFTNTPIILYSIR